MPSSLPSKLLQLSDLMAVAAIDPLSAGAVKGLGLTRAR
jgi:hypothetical protein